MNTNIDSLNIGDIIQIETTNHTLRSGAGRNVEIDTSDNFTVIGINKNNNQTNTMVIRSYNNGISYTLTRNNDNSHIQNGNTLFRFGYSPGQNIYPEDLPNSYSIKPYVNRIFDTAQDDAKILKWFAVLKNTNDINEVNNILDAILESSQIIRHKIKRSEFTKIIKQTKKNIDETTKTWNRDTAKKVGGIFKSVSQDGGSNRYYIVY